MDIEKIRALGATKGFRRDYEIAEVLGITKETFSRKLHGKVPFTSVEIGRAIEYFGISKKQAGELFL